jgi:hypothetical protein
VEALPAPPALLRPRIVLLALDAHVEAVREQLDRLRELERLGLLHELERVAALAAAEAVVELLVGIHREGGRALVVEGAQPDPACADPAQVRLLAHQVDHVDCVAYPVDRVSGEQRHQEIRSNWRIA